jgi:fatty acid desaturase
VENNLKVLRDLPIPTFLKWIALPLVVTTWKWFYYAPNTYKELKLARWRKAGKKIPDNWRRNRTLMMFRAWDPFYSFSEFFSVVIGPYLLIHFFLFPLPLLAIGEYVGSGHDMYISAVKNLFLAELLTNFHAFVAIVTNHAGDDLYRFRDGCRPYSGSFYLRQVLASVDFWTGSDLNDFMHGFLNYQIEHHLWPNLSMLSYQKSQPHVKALCQKHGVPYIQENVFKRTKKTIDIMVGSSSMRWFPADYEKKFLERDAVIEAAKKTRKAVTLSDKCMDAAVQK